MPRDDRGIVDLVSPWLCECILNRRKTRSNDGLSTCIPFSSVFFYPSEWYIVWCSTPALAAGARAGRASFGGAVMPRDDRGLAAGAKAVMPREKIDE